MWLSFECSVRRMTFFSNRNARVISISSFARAHFKLTIYQMKFPKYCEIVVKTIKTKISALQEHWPTFVFIRSHSFHSRSSKFSKTEHFSKYFIFFFFSILQVCKRWKISLKIVLNKPTVETMYISKRQSWVTPILF